MAAKPLADVVSAASSLVSSQSGLPANEIRALDKRLDSLGAEAAKQGRRAVPSLAASALDASQPLKLRIWLVSYLQAVHDPDAFPPLRRLLLDPAQPDLLREAAVRALAGCPVSAPARSRALCDALVADPGPEARMQALFELGPLGCENPAALERWAAAGGSKPSGRAAAEAGHAIQALARTRATAALDALDRLAGRYARGQALRGAVLRALTGRAAELARDPERWNERARALLTEESRFPENAQAALALVAALGDPASAELAARYLNDPDAGVVVAAAETLAALKARAQRPAVVAVFDGFYADPRFAGGPGRDPTAWYGRLAAALKALQ